MEPVEINAGAWYLRGVPDDECYRWEVCEPITGQPVAQVTLHPDTATMSSHGDNTDAVTAAERAVRRFAAAALGVTVRD